MSWIISLAASLLHFSLLFFSHFIQLFLFFPFLLLTNLLCHPRQISVAEYVSLCFFSLLIVVLQCITNAFTSVALLRGVEAEIKSVNQRTLCARTMDGLITQNSASTTHIWFCLTRNAAFIWSRIIQITINPNIGIGIDQYYRIEIVTLGLYQDFICNNYLTGLVIKLEWCSRVFCFYLKYMPKICPGS